MKSVGPNSTPPSNGGHVGTGTRWRWKILMVNAKRLGGMAHFASWLPRTVRNVVAYSVHIILQLSTPETRVQNLMDLKLLHSIHLDCWRGVHDPSGERICHVGLQEANVKHRVNFDGTWQLPTKSRGPDLLQNLKRT